MLADSGLRNTKTGVVISPRDSKKDCFTAANIINEWVHVVNPTLEDPDPLGLHDCESHTYLEP